MDNSTLFIIGVIVSIPTSIVVIALVFASGIDEREEERLRVARPSATLP